MTIRTSTRKQAITGGGRSGFQPVYMGIKALDTYGFLEEADAIAEQTLEHMYQTYHNPEAHKLNKGKPTIWECYNPTVPLPSTEGKRTARKDFCG